MVKLTATHKLIKMNGPEKDPESYVQLHFTTNSTTTAASRPTFDAVRFAHKTIVCSLKVARILPSQLIDWRPGVTFLESVPLHPEGQRVGSPASAADLFKGFNVPLMLTFRPGPLIDIVYVQGC